MQSKSISILGCGWLGFPLAQCLIQLGFTVKGSTTTVTKFSAFQENHIHPFYLTCDPVLRGENLKNFFESKILFLNIPFKRDLADPLIYTKQIESVVKCAENSSVEFIIFASSTSVYPDTMLDAYEDLDFQPDNPRSQVLFEIEKNLLQNKHFNATVIRFAGLCGGNRQVGKFLSHKKNLENADSPVNLIYLDDCVDIVVKIIQHNIRSEIFNACCDEHPTRRELYTKTALNLGLEPPQFIDSKKVHVKVVRNKKIKEQLGYTFKYPDPLNFP